jgi:hypothetical protein
MHPELTSYLVAEATLLVARRRDLEIFVKREIQRTNAERAQLERGLVRSFVLDMAMLPLSTYALLASIRFLLPQTLIASSAGYGLLGLISYGFPLASFKQAVTFWALHLLRHYSQVLSESGRQELQAIDGHRMDSSIDTHTGNDPSTTQGASSSGSNAETKRPRKRRGQSGETR